MLYEVITHLRTADFEFDLIVDGTYPRDRFTDEWNVMIPDPVPDEAVGNLQQDMILVHLDKADRFYPGGEMLGIQCLLEVSERFLPESIHGLFSGDGVDRGWILLEHRNGTQVKIISTVL